MLRFSCFVSISVRIVVRSCFDLGLGLALALGMDLCLPLESVGISIGYQQLGLYTRYNDNRCIRILLYVDNLSDIVNSSVHHSISCVVV